MGARLALFPFPLWDGAAMGAARPLPSTTVSRGYRAHINDNLVLIPDTRDACSLKYADASPNPGVTSIFAASGDLVNHSVSTSRNDPD